MGGQPARNAEPVDLASLSGETGEPLEEPEFAGPASGTGKQLTPEEREYSELLTVLIEAFEDAHYDLQGSTPGTRLRSLLEEHGLRQRDLLGVFGSRGIASEVVSGKRAISKAQAKKLAELFHVPADLFL